MKVARERKGKRERERERERNFSDLNSYLGKVGYNLLFCWQGSKCVAGCFSFFQPLQSAGYAETALSYSTEYLIVKSFTD